MFGFPRVSAICVGRLATGKRVGFLIGGTSSRTPERRRSAARRWGLHLVADYPELYLYTRLMLTVAVIMHDV